MAKKTAKEIVEEQMPDMEIVETPPAAAPDSVRRVVKPGPSMADLRRKYLGADAGEDDDDGVAAAANAPSADEGDVEVKTVRPKRTPADPAEDPGPRSVIISKKRGLLGSQG